MWSNMKATQEILDKRIMTEHGLEMGDLFEERILALTDEVMEYAKSTKCFKYWSLKEPDFDHMRLEEFVDGIHFYLSFFNELEIPAEKIKLAESYPDYKDKGDKKEVITHNIKMSLKWLMRAAGIHCDQLERQDCMLKSFGHFWRCGLVDGFDAFTIEKAYYLKSQKNHYRQDNGY